METISRAARSALLACGLGAAACSPCSAQEEAETSHLSRLKYNHSGLVVDLGVGLWGVPLPMDYDGDGVADLLVGWGRRPPGINLYKRIGDDPAGITFDAGTLVSNHRNRLQTSLSNGKWWMTSDEKLFPDFVNTGIEEPMELPYEQQRYEGRAASFSRYTDVDGDGTPDVLLNARAAELREDNRGEYDSEGRWQAEPKATGVWWVRNEGTAEEPKFGKTAAQRIQADGEDLRVEGEEPSFMDFDGDGLPDLLFTLGVDELAFFRNTGTPTEPAFAAGKTLARNGEPIRFDLEMLNPAGVDFDSDGDADLLVGEEDGRVSLLRNTGETADGMPVFEAPVFLQQEAYELKYGVLPTPVGFDFDADGDTDLVAGNSAGYFAFIENLGGTPPKWAEPVDLKADGEAIRILAGESGSIQGPEEAKWGYTTVSVVDWDLDGLPDLLSNSVWGRVSWYRNTGTPKQPTFATAETIDVEWEGEAPKPEWTWWEPGEKELAAQWRTSVQGIELTGDDLPDLVAVDDDGYLALFERFREGDELKLRPGKRVFRVESGEKNVYYHAQYKSSDENLDGMNDFSGRAANGKLAFLVGRDGIEWVDRSDDPRYDDPEQATALRLSPGWKGRSGRSKFVLTDWDHDGKIDLLNNSGNVNFFRNVSEEAGTFVFRDLGPLDPHSLAGHTTAPGIIDVNGDGIEDVVMGAEDGFFYYLPHPADPRAWKPDRMDDWAEPYVTD